MALRTDRPGAGGDDGVAVHVARSLAEARRARDGLLAAGVLVDMPDAALEVLFAEGPGASVTIKVKGKDLARALDVIEELFPREVIDLPPLPDAKPAAAGGPAASATGATRAAEPDLDAATARAQGPRLRRMVDKLLIVGGGAVVIPGLGLLLGLLGVVGGLWTLGQVAAEPTVASQVRSRIFIAMLLSALGLAGNLVLAVSWLHRH